MSINDNALTHYSHLITTRPYDICRVLISDLHLSADEPALVQAFLALVDDLIALPNLREFYILGDWFDAWIGDDSYLSLSSYELQNHWLTPLIGKLSQLSANGCQIKVMHGNRDFLIGQPFCDLFQAELIFEPYVLGIGDNSFRLEHGDALCTDDKSYQRFRSVMRSPFIQWALLKRPLPKRVKLAQKMRQKSALNKSTKSMSIMDVNQDAVIKALTSVDQLLHGHTHRPNRHTVEIDTEHNITKQRYVLGDWRVINPDSSCQKVEAVIAVTTIETPSLDSNSAESDGAQKESLQLVKFALKT